MAGRHDGVLLCGPAGGTEVGCLPDPDPQIQQRRLDALADGIDHTGAVLVRNLWRVHSRTGLAATTRLPVGRVDAGAVDPHSHLTRTGIGQRPIDEGQDVGVAGHGVLDRTHVLDVIP